MKLFTSIIISHLIDEEPSATSYPILVKIDPPLWINIRTNSNLLSTAGDLTRYVSVYYVDDYTRFVIVRLHGTSCYTQLCCRYSI